MPRSRNRSKARRRLASDGLLPRVIIGSTTRRSSLALGRVVVISSCRRSETVMLRNIASRWLDVRPSFRRPSPCRMLGPVLQTGGRPVLELHAEREGARCQHFLDLVERLAPEVDRKSTRLNSSHLVTSYRVFCLKEKILA